MRCTETSTPPSEFYDNRFLFDLQLFADDGGEKTEEPTAKKKSDARNKGQVAKSQELNAAFVLFIGFWAMKILGSTIQQLEKDKTRSRCRKWRLWVTTEAGRKSRRHAGTYTSAQEALEAFKSELGEIVPNSDTFAAYADSWRLWREKSGDVSPNTVAKDRRNVRALCRTGLSTLRMDEIAPEDCRNALLWLKEHPAHREKELSGTTVRTFYVALNSILQQAEDDGKIAANPLRKVKPPKEDTREKTAISPPEIQLLLNRLDEMPTDAHVMAVYLMLCLGLRRGEALALQDADVRDGFAHVHLAVKEADGTIGEPKSESGKRTLPMPPRLRAKVDEWRAVRKSRGLSDAPTLCCNADGGTMRPQNLYKWWTGCNGRKSGLGARDALGCPGMGLHELRHSNLSMMARHMSPFDLQRYAGWSSIEPAQVYIHDDLDAVSSAVASAWNCIEAVPDAPLAHQNAKQAKA